MVASISLAGASVGSINEGTAPRFTQTATLNSVWEVIQAAYPQATPSETYFLFTLAPDASSEADSSDFSDGSITLYTNGDAFSVFATTDDSLDENDEAISLQSALSFLIIENDRSTFAVLRPDQVAALFAASGGLTLDIGKITGTIVDNDDPPPNTAPIANADSASTDQNTPLTIASATLLNNDEDSDVGDTLSITGVSNAQNGIVSFNNGNVLFTPNEDFTGAASFEYTITDGEATATAKVSVNVTAVAGINRSGGTGRDTLTGSVGRDTLSGGNAEDILNGGAGGDTLRGDNGNDTLIGGTGSDTVTGGNGNDVFVLAVGAGTDTITDFKTGTDFIGLSGGLSFAQLSRSGNTISANGEVLATLTGINTANLTQSSFIAV